MFLLDFVNTSYLTLVYAAFSYFKSEFRKQGYAFQAERMVHHLFRFFFLLFALLFQVTHHCSYAFTQQRYFDSAAAQYHAFGSS